MTGDDGTYICQRANPQANNNMSAEFLPNKSWTIPVLYYVHRFIRP